MRISSAIPLYAIFGLCLSSCQTEREESTASSEVSMLLNQANDNHLPLSRRFAFALQADSIAELRYDARSQMDSKNILADLFLNADSLNIAKSFFLDVSKIAKGLSDTERYGVAIHNVGLIYSELSENDSALDYYLKALSIFRSHNDLRRMAQALGNIGIVYKNQGYFEKAFTVNLEAAKLLEAPKLLEAQDARVELGSVYGTLGNLQKELGQFNSALEYHFKALKQQEEGRDTIGYAGTLNNIGNVYRNKKQFNEALKYYLKSLEMKNRLGHTKAIATTVDNIAESYLELKDYKKAELFFRKELELRYRLHDRDGFLTSSNRLSKLYLLKGDLSKANSIAADVLSEIPAFGFLRQRLENFLLLSEIAKRQRKYDIALAYADYALRLKDSLSNSDMAVAVSKMNVRYNVDRKEKDLQLSQELQSIQTSRIYTQRKLILLLVGTLIFLAVVIWQLFCTNKARKKAKQRVEILMAELNHRVKNNLQIVSDMLYLQQAHAKEGGDGSILDASIQRIQAISTIHEILHRSNYIGSVNLKELIEHLILNIFRAHDEVSHKLLITMDIQNTWSSIDIAVPLGLILNELITNMLKHAIKGAHKSILNISLTEETSLYKLETHDNCGYWNITEMRQKQIGLGLILIETLIQQLHGSWKTKSSNLGTEHTIVISKNS